MSLKKRFIKSGAVQLFIGIASLFLFLSQSFAQYQPDRDLKDLFTDVQLEKVFPDSKTFADCIPLKPVDSIRHYYSVQKSQPGFSLAGFVRHYFEIPKSLPVKEATSFSSIDKHIDSLWMVLERSSSASQGSLLGLPNSYVVPGGRFNEIYYWDSYFTMLGLYSNGNYEMMENMVTNFAFLIDKYGHIPNGNRSYYLSRSQPPFFALMVGLVAKEKDDSVYIQYLPQLITEYNFWMEGVERLSPEIKVHRRVVRLSDGSILNRYWDDNAGPRSESYREDVKLAEGFPDKEELYRNIRAACESGWDFSSRWFKDGLNLQSIRTTEIIPIDLNCLLYNLELTIANAFQLKGDLSKYQLYTGKAEKRKAAIVKFCWNNAFKFYMDYDWVEKRSTKVFSLAALFPLFFKIASDQQAKEINEQLLQSFLYPGGMVSTPVLSHQQWDAPNGWAPLQWITYSGLKNYGYKEFADTLKNRWMRTIERQYQMSGKLLEKYNVVNPDVAGGGGEYPTQDGFGWTNGVYLQFKNEK